MALPILDGNQTATTLATTVSGSAHYPNHIIASGTVTANIGTAVVQVVNAIQDGDGTTFGIDRDFPISGTVTANLGTSSRNEVYEGILRYAQNEGGDGSSPLYVVGQINIGSALPAGTNRIGVVTIGAGTVTLGASTSQIGSVTASISGTVPISISSVTVGNSITIGSCVTHGVTISNSSVTINGSITANLTYSQTAVSLSSTAATAIPIVLPTNGVYGGTLQGYNGTNTYIYSGIQAIGGTSLASATSLPVSLGLLPALAAGTAQIGSVTAFISNTAVTVYSAQGTTVTNSNFTSLTSSTSLVSAVAGRKVLSVFNEGVGNLHISPNATCTTISYQVRLSAGDYWECPSGQLSLAHTAVFATAGTARITEVS